MHPVAEAMDALVFGAGQPIDVVAALPISVALAWTWRLVGYRQRIREAQR